MVPREAVWEAAELLDAWFQPAASGHVLSERDDMRDTLLEEAFEPLVENESLLTIEEVPLEFRLELDGILDELIERAEDIATTEDGDARLREFVDALSPFVGRLALWARMNIRFEDLDLSE